MQSDNHHCLLGNEVSEVVLINSNTERFSLITDLLTRLMITLIMTVVEEEVMVMMVVVFVMSVI